MLTTIRLRDAVLCRGDNWTGLWTLDTCFQSLCAAQFYTQGLVGSSSRAAWRHPIQRNLWWLHRQDMAQFYMQGIWRHPIQGNLSWLDMAFSSTMVYGIWIHPSRKAYRVCIMYVCLGCWGVCMCMCCVCECIMYVFVWVGYVYIHIYTIHISTYMCMWRCDRIFRFNSSCYSIRSSHSRALLGA